jgi:hypothetical protein
VGKDRVGERGQNRGYAKRRVPENVFQKK